MKDNWFQLNAPHQVDSPALLIYKDRVQQNIDLMLQIAGSSERLIPHVKTHKMAEIVLMQLEVGITQFKCATIAEAEMLAMAGAKWVLLAYQLTSPKTERFIQLIEKYPNVSFSSLVDNQASGRVLNNIFQEKNLTAQIFIDVNNGMNRTGHEVNEALIALFFSLNAQTNIEATGFHLFDGHIREEDFQERKAHCDADFEPLNELIIKHLHPKNIKPVIVAGGSPTFPVHALRKDVFCSPGTCLLWDWGYGDRFTEQTFLHAAVILTRVISKPKSGIITIDLGHKGVAAENPIDKRFRFFNLSDYQILSQSEEHGVVQVANWEQINIGDELYAIPYHVCPTVNLYEQAHIILEGNLLDTWKVLARNRRIKI
jgi:D-serine deaminase-like pyridoxal phosphate-dependent protein